MNSKMLTEKPIKIILIFSIPLLLAYWSQQLYYILDWMIVGQFLGEKALAAIGAPGSIFFLLNGIIQGMAAGFGIVLAKRAGRRQTDGMRQSFAFSMMLSLIISIPLMIILILLLEPMLLSQNVDPEIFEATKLYVLVFFLGLPISLMNWLFSGNLRAVGNVKVPFIANMIASFLNIILDLLFIGVFGMDVWTTALTNVIAQGLIAVICYLYIHYRYIDLRPQKKDFVLSWHETVEHLKMGIPTALQFVITSIGVLVIQTAINGGGSAVIAGWTNGAKIDVLSCQPLQAIAVSISVFFAQNHAVNNYKRLRQGYFASLILGGAATVFAMSVTFFLGTPLTYLFVANPSQELLSYSNQYLIMFTMFCPSILVLLISRNALQAMGYHVFPLIGALLETISRIVAFLFVPTQGFKAMLASSASAWTTAGIALSIALIIHLFRKKPSDIKPEDQMFQYAQ